MSTALQMTATRSFIKTRIKIRPTTRLGIPSSATERTLGVAAVVTACKVEVTARPGQISFTDQKPSLSAEINISKDGQEVMSRTFEETFRFRQLTGNQMPALEELARLGMDKWQICDSYIPVESYSDPNQVLGHLLTDWYVRHRAGTTTTEKIPGQKSKSGMDFFDDIPLMDVARYLYPQNRPIVVMNPL